MAGWEVYFSCPRAFDSTQAYLGTRSVKYTPNSTVNPQGFIVRADPRAGSVWSGARIRSSIWIKGHPDWYMAFSTRSNISIGTPSSIEGYNNQNLYVPTEWGRWTVETVLPANADGSRRLYYGFGCQGRTVSGVSLTNQTTWYAYIDAALIEVHPDGAPFTDVPDTYFDGSTVGGEWLGPANESPSILRNAPILYPATAKRWTGADWVPATVQRG